MNDIFKIQDYSNRLNSSNIETFQRFKQLEKPEDRSSNFEEMRKKQVQEDLQGKVSSSQISFPVRIKEEINADPYRKKLYDASVEFESIFVKMMLKEMKSTVSKSGLIDGGHAEEIFEDMLYDEYARDISKSSNLGLAEQIYSSMSKNLPSIDIDKKI